MHLGAARQLCITVSSDHIAQTKTRAIIGDTSDFTSLEYEGEEDLTEVLDGSTDQKRHLKKHLLAEARSFRELETLIICLDYIETIVSFGALLEE